MANPGPNRYVYSTSPARYGNGAVQSSLIQAPRFSERPGIVPHEVICLNVVKRAHLADCLFPRSYLKKQEGLNSSLRFISVQATTNILAASLTFIFILMPRSNSRPLSRRLK